MRYLYTYLKFNKNDIYLIIYVFIYMFVLISLWIYSLFNINILINLLNEYLFIGLFLKFYYMFIHKSIFWFYVKYLLLDWFTDFLFINLFIRSFISSFPHKLYPTQRVAEGKMFLIRTFVSPVLFCSFVFLCFFFVSATLLIVRNRILWNFVVMMDILIV